MDKDDIVPGPVAAEKTENATSAEKTSFKGLPDRIVSALQANGIDGLYAHQKRAIDSYHAGDNIIVATPTASGKSLIYTIPALEAAKERDTVLYIAPMRALINDQAGTFEQYAYAAGLSPSMIARYTGQLSSHQKRTVRDKEPRILLTTVDMVHYSLLPYAEQSTWSWFFEALDQIVIDEIHTYRGVFGSHVSLLFRRLERILDRYGQDPGMIGCSATIGNPEEHARRLTGRSSWTTITEDTSATGDKHWVIVDNDTSPHPISKTIMQRLVDDGYQTLAFTRARQTAERYARTLASEYRSDGYASMADRITPYHAALSDDERETVEKQIKSGKAQGIWSTTALELGIDIGTLDAVVLDGYPGSRMQTHQQAGRAGRGDDESFVFLVPGQDNLDQYMAENTDELFAEPEKAQANPENDAILDDHLVQATREAPLRTEELDAFPIDENRLQQLRDAGRLKQRDNRWVPAEKQQGMPFSLRNIGDRNVTIRTTKGETITSLSYSDAINDVYPDAVYLHNGRQYVVSDFDTVRDTVTLQPAEDGLDYYTQPTTEKQITVESRLAEREYETVTIFLAAVEVHGHVEGYIKKDKATNQTRRRTTYTSSNRLPFSFHTRAIGFEFHETPSVDTLGDGLHAAEHAMIGIMPLYLLCDRRHDLGGLSTERHQSTGSPSIFIHEGHDGDVGLVTEAYELLDDIVTDAKTTITTCDCKNGCDSCIYSPTCGNANNHLSKDGGHQITAFLEDV
ncbi:MAG: DEAD/DEAH box helicase, partial [Candidatus Nanohaloarchaeota archaeon QJJ-5]|nr:DEAD/DEAH box helicase [Candidatus Nanohaloarchaeota archaeon QJJ-5]